MHLQSYCLYLSIAPPIISNLTFDVVSLTLTCTSTGSPATNVTWTLNDATVDGITTLSVTDRQTSTYSNTLTIAVPGNYTCHISNALGGDSMDITVDGM